MRSVNVSRLWLLLPALFALGLFWSVLQHGFRSDDFLAVYYLDRDTDAVRWGRVFEEWARPWFGVRDLYRPLVSLAYGCNWLCGTSAFGFHLLNLLLLCGSATAVAALAARLAGAPHRALVGLIAGLLVVLHPAAVEPTAWIAARTTGLQVMFSAIAYWSFVRWRDGDGRVWLPLLATALACASKEGAVLLPFSLLMLDLVRGRGLPNWRVHLPFFGLVGGYLVFRKLLLGVFTTAEEGHTVLGRLQGAVELFGQLTVPPIGGGYSLGGWLFFAMFLFVGQGLLAGGTRRALWCLPWALGLLTPGTTHVGAAGGELAGRFVFDAVPALAVFVALGFARMPLSKFERFRFGLGFLGIVVGLGIAQRHWLQRYDDDSRLIDRVQQELLVHAKDAGPGKPYGVIGLPGLPLLQPALWGFLTQRPFAERDLPVVGLSHILQQTKGAENVFTDTLMMHALVADGAGCGVWHDEGQRLVPVAGSEAAVVDFVQDANDPRRFLPPRLLSPTAVAKLEIRSPTPVRSWRAEILGNLEGEYAADPLLATSAGQQAWFDTEHVLPWMVAASFGGGPAGVVLQGDGAPPPVGTKVRAHARLDPLAIDGVVAGTIERSALATVIDRPDERRGYRLYVLLPTGLWSMELAARAPVELDGIIRDQLTFACDVLGSAAVHWLCYEEPPLPGRPSRRSTFGSRVLR